MKKIILLAFATLVALLVATMDGKSQIVLPQIINANLTLTAGQLYILNGKTYVTNNAILTIPAGTRIQANHLLPNDLASALIITRGAKLYAEGTSTNPIVFTSNESSPASGDWGGIVLLGKAPLNRADTIIEGINKDFLPPGINYSDVSYGGGGAGVGDVSDCSGRLIYVRIEYAGTAIATDNELNGLTCGGVGNGTVLDFIEVYYGNDDAFQFFGGTVNAKHLFAYVPNDDAFDFTYGYSGKIQFALSVLNTTETYSANPNGIESENNGTASIGTPLTQPVLSNFTVIGLNTNTDATIKALQNGALFRRRSSYILRNSIVMGFPTGIHLQSVQSQGDIGNIKSCLVHAFVDPVKCTNPTVLCALGGSNQVYQSTVNTANSYILLQNPFAATPDFRPATGSPALTLARDFSGLPSTPAAGCAFVPWTFSTVAYVGAFGAYNAASPFINNWLGGWARY